MNTDRFIAINLTEAEWKALRMIRPDPSGWLKQQVVRALEDAGYSATVATREATSAQAN